MKTAKTMTMRRATSSASFTRDRLRRRGCRCRVVPGAPPPCPRSSNAGGADLRPPCATGRPASQAAAGSPSPGTRCGCGAGGLPGRPADPPLRECPASPRPPYGYAGPGGPPRRAPRAQDAPVPHGSWPFSGPHSFGSGTPGGSIVRRFGPPCSDSPGSFAPGQAFATRAARTKSLRRGWPSKPSGSRRGTRCGWSAKSTPNISCVSRSCQAAPAVHTDRRRQDRGLVRHRRTDEEAADPGPAGPAGRQRRHVRADPEARARFVHRAQPVEVGAAEAVAGRFEGGDPRGGRDVDREEVVRLLGGGLLAEDLGDRVREPVEGDRVREPVEGVGHFPSSSPAAGGGVTRPLRRAAVDGRPPAASAYRSPSDSRAIFSWSFRMPWSRASGRGGQPGT